MTPECATASQCPGTGSARAPRGFRSRAVSGRDGAGVGHRANSLAARGLSPPAARPRADRAGAGAAPRSLRAQDGRCLCSRPGAGSEGAAAAPGASAAGPALPGAAGM